MKVIFSTFLFVSTLLISVHSFAIDTLQIKLKAYENVLQGNNHAAYRATVGGWDFARGFSVVIFPVGLVVGGIELCGWNGPFRKGAKHDAAYKRTKNSYDSLQRILGILGTADNLVHKNPASDKENKIFRAFASTLPMDVDNYDAVVAFAVQLMQFNQLTDASFLPDLNKLSHEEGKGKYTINFDEIVMNAFRRWHESNCESTCNGQQT